MVGRDEGMTEGERLRQTRREKELKMGRENRNSTLLKEGEGREGDREKKKETKTKKETETLRNRLYLGTPQCGGLV